ncbi:MAG: M3 family metallopeptidase [Bacteroidales bacterium]
MKKTKLLLFSLAFMSMTQAQNPFFGKYKTPHETAPFDKIKFEHYEPAFLEGMKQHNKEVDAIINNKKPATFENTIVALERSGELFGRVGSVFFNLTSSESNDDMMALSQKLSPLMSAHSNNINLNEKLFARVKEVYDQRESLNLSIEDRKLLENTYKGFVKRGANLQGEDKEKYRELSTTLSKASLDFGQNVLKQTNAFEMVVENVEDLKGLMQRDIDEAKARAEAKGKTGYLFTHQAPVYISFMRYVENRDLRRQMWESFSSKCIGGEFDNIKNVETIANSRLAMANLFGFENYAAYTLQDRMAKNQESVYKLLNDLLVAFKPTAMQEVAEVRGFAIGMEGKNFEIMPWDWSFYAEKLKDSKYQINDELLRPYFELNNVTNGVFGLATDLWGITFKENKKIQVYHPEVKAYEVFDADGKFLSVLYTDFHPRAGKRPGAWMSGYKSQYKENGKDSRPHVTIVMNFTRPTADTPALLTFDEVETFLHEFGHALHGMFANSTYESLSGTSVYRDFVELPSQMMENWLSEKEYLDKFAVHYKTGEKIPADLVQKVLDAKNYNVAYACVRQLSFGFNDMAWHTITKPFSGDVKQFENDAIAHTQLLPTVSSVALTPAFSHVFAGGYAAGYYSYKWAEVLDADAYDYFVQNGIYNKEIAKSFRENILEKGGTEDPMVLYVRFRGEEPSVKALMKRSGIEVKL